MLRALRNIGIIAGLAIVTGLLLHLLWEACRTHNPISYEQTSQEE